MYLDCPICFQVNIIYDIYTICKNQFLMYTVLLRIVCKILKNTMFFNICLDIRGVMKQKSLGEVNKNNKDLCLFLRRWLDNKALQEDIFCQHWSTSESPSLTLVQLVLVVPVGYSSVLKKWWKSWINASWLLHLEVVNTSRP